MQDRACRQLSKRQQYDGRQESKDRGGTDGFPQVIVPARAEFLCHQDTEALGEALDDTKHHPVEPVRRAKGGKGADT